MTTDPAFARRLAKLSVLKERLDAPEPDFFGTMVNLTVMFEKNTEKLSEKETADMVIQMSADPPRKIDVGQALVCLMMTEKEQTDKYIHLLSQMGDMWFQALYTLNMVSIEMFGKLQESCKDQILVFFKEAIKFNVPKLDSTLQNFVKTFNGTGEWGSRLRLAKEFATLFMDQKDYMFGSMKSGSTLYGLVINTYGHIIADIAQNPLLDKEKNVFVDLLTLIIRKKPQESFLLGRDLFFCLMRISKIPKILDLLTDLIKTPTTFGIKAFDEVLFKSCIPPICASRISSDISKKVDFMIMGMRFNGQSKHLDWFTAQHLKGPDSQSMRAELIRYVLFYFPQNQQGNIYEARMQFIHWIINTASFGTESQWCKAALWFDWLFCDQNTPFYALEPALAVVRYCIGVQATKASSLLEYLIKSVKEIYPQMSPRVALAANVGMKIINDFFESNGQPSVSNILESPRVDSGVRDGIRAVFKDFVSAQDFSKNNNNVKEMNDKAKKETRREEALSRRSKSPSPPQTRLRRTMSKEEQEKELELNLTQLRDDFKDAVEMVRTAFTSEESDEGDKGESVGKLLQKLLENEDNVEEEQHWMMGHCLLAVMGRPEAEKSFVPEPNSELQDIYQDIFSHPIFIVFRNLCFTPINETTSRTPLVRIIAAMREKDNFITIFLLYFIKCGFGPGTSSNDYLKCYEEVANASDKEVSEMLTEDLETIALEDEQLFSLLLTFVFEKYLQDIGSSPELLKIICYHIDSSQLSAIVGSMIREGTMLFRKDNICNLITASLEWTTAAQFFLWHLKSVPFDWMLSVVPKIKSEQHTEAVVNLLITLKRIDREPGMNLLRTILSRTPSKDDFFTINCFRALINDSDMANKVAELIGQLIKKMIANGEIHMGNNQTTQKTQTKKVAVKLCLEQLLSHMQCFIEHCLSKEQKVAETLLSKREIQEAFKTITCNEKSMMMKHKFQPLFTVMELLADDSPQSSRTLRGNRGNNHPKASKRQKDDDDDLPNQSKQKKRQVVTIDSDSD